MASSMTEAPESAPTVAARAPELRAGQIHCMMRPPPWYDYAPEYDYLALLRSLRDASDLATAETPRSSTPQLLKDFQRTPCDGSCGTRLITSSGSSEWMSAPLSDFQRSPGSVNADIRNLRQRLVEGGQGNTRVLIVDGDDTDLLQILGVAIGLDSTFLWRHYNEELDAYHCIPEMAKLRKEFYRRVRAEKGRRAEADTDQELLTNEDRNLHIRYELLDGRSLRATREHEAYSHISCYPCSANSWLILTHTDDFGQIAISGDFMKYDRFPSLFSGDKVLRSRAPFDASRLPLDIGVYLESENGLSDRPWDSKELSNARRGRAQKSHDTFQRMLVLLTSKSSIFARGKKLSGYDVVFGQRNKFLTPASFGLILGRLLEVSGWEKNISALDRHLGRLSMEAMLRASLDTFRPIPTLRQNVADLRDALQKASDSVGHTDTTAFAQLQDITSNQLESLDSVFGVLLRRTDALSAKVSNEIQLVIGSVTTQDSSMMKRQSRRATLLTLLAAFYLPLTLVTGIFGMNIREFDGKRAPPFSLCFVALVAVVAVTAIFYGLYRYLPLAFPTPRKRKDLQNWELTGIGRCLEIISAPFRKIYHLFLELEKRRQ